MTAISHSLNIKPFVSPNPYAWNRISMPESISGTAKDAVCRPSEYFWAHSFNSGRFSINKKTLGFILLWKDVLDLPLTLVQKAVLCRVISAAEGNSHVSNKELADSIGVNRDTINESFKILERRGYARRIGGKGLSRRFETAFRFSDKEIDGNSDYPQNNPSKRMSENPTTVDGKSGILNKMKKNRVDGNSDMLDGNSGISSRKTRHISIKKKVNNIQEPEKSYAPKRDEFLITDVLPASREDYIYYEVALRSGRKSKILMVSNQDGVNQDLADKGKLIGKKATVEFKDYDSYGFPTLPKIVAIV